MSAGAVPYPIVPPLPEKETQSGRTRETKTLAPEQLEALKGQQAVTDEAILAENEKAAQAKKVADVGFDQAKGELDLGKQIDQQKQAAAASIQPEIDEWKSRLRGAQDKYDQAPPPSLFAGTQGWGTARRVMALALGGIGDAIQKAAMVRIGREAPNMDTVGNIIERELQSQREAIGKLKDSVVTARTGLTDANEARRVMLSDIDVKGAAAMQHLERFARARLAALKTPQADIDAHQAIIALAEKRAGYQAKAVEPLTESVTKRYEEITRDNNPGAANKAAAAADKAESNTARNEAGQEMGEVLSGRGGAAAFTTRDANLGKGIEQLKDLIADVKEHGARVYGNDAVKRRMGKYASGLSAVAAASSLNQSDETQKLEAASLGPSGALDFEHPGSVVRGASLESLERKLKELETARERFRRQSLRPLPGRSEIVSSSTEPPPPSTRAPAFTPTQRADMAATAPPAPTQPPPFQPAAPAAGAPPPPPPAPDRSTALRQGAVLLQQLRAKNPKDPRIPAIEARMRELIRGG